MSTVDFWGRVGGFVGFAEVPESSHTTLCGRGTVAGSSGVVSGKTYGWKPGSSEADVGEGGPALSGLGELLRLPDSMEGDLLSGGLATSVDFSEGNGDPGSFPDGSGLVFSSLGFSELLFSAMPTYISPIGSRVPLGSGSVRFSLEERNKTRPPGTGVFLLFLTKRLRRLKKTIATHISNMTPAVPPRAPPTIAPMLFDSSTCSGAASVSTGGNSRSVVLAVVVKVVLTGIVEVMKVVAVSVSVCGSSSVVVGGGVEDTGDIIS